MRKARCGSGAAPRPYRRRTGNSPRAASTPGKSRWTPRAGSFWRRRAFARSPCSISYDFPAGAQGAKIAKGYRGQIQAWFAFRFEGDDAEVDLNVQDHQEFDAWRWADIDEAIDLVAHFKRDAYIKVIEAFNGLVDQVKPPGA
jgi:8-oxo-dGTP pyrophosphatase MutT (NUDIX family)